MLMNWLMDHRLEFNTYKVTFEVSHCNNICRRVYNRTCCQNPLLTPKQNKLEDISTEIVGLVQISSSHGNI